LRTATNSDFAAPLLLDESMLFKYRWINIEQTCESTKYDTYYCYIDLNLKIMIVGIVYENVR